MANVEILIEDLQDIGYDNHVLSAVVYGPHQLELSASQEEFNAAVEALQESDAVLQHIYALRSLVARQIDRQRGSAPDHSVVAGA